MFFRVIHAIHRSLSQPKPSDYEMRRYWSRFSNDSLKAWKALEDEGVVVMNSYLGVHGVHLMFPHPHVCEGSKATQNVVHSDVGDYQRIRRTDKPVFITQQVR